MNTPFLSSTQNRRFPRSAFSLVEILVSISLLSFIVLGLLLMFNQTQRAFRGSMSQTDMLESGRIVTDMLAREIEQTCPAGDQPYYGSGIYDHANFFAELSPTISTPFEQKLPGSAALRMNVVQRFFFVSRENQDWIGTGYVVLTNRQGGEVGTLYRFSSSRRPPFSDYDLATNFLGNINVALDALRNNLPVTNLSRVAEGVVHLQVRAFAPNGRPLLPFINSSNLVVQMPNGAYADVGGTYWNLPAGMTTRPELAGCYFADRAVPGSVEIEVGMLEQNILGRYKALAGNTAAQRDYLSDRVGNVHVFRQRIPIRNVNPSVYP